MGAIAMRTGVLARRTFTLDDQRAFAALSGDWNPMHVDPVAVRRTLFDAPVVHGVHLVVWALDVVLEQPVVVRRLRAAWKKPALIGRELVLERRSATALVATTAAGERVLDLTLEVEPGAPPAHAVPSHAWPTAEPPRERTREEAAVARGALPLAIDVERARGLAPVALHCLGPAVLAEMLALTRLVGMDTPGAHSLFAGLDVAAAPGPAVLEFEVARANLKYAVLDLAVRGPTLAGTLATLYRPPPQRGPSHADVVAAVAPGEFAGRRALVVGGSRGLGEALARALAVGGAEVWLTYHRGAAEAQRIVDELRAAGAAIDAVPLDVLAPPLALPGAPTHVYYLATPRIPAVRRFAYAELEHMLRYYVGGLAAVIDALPVAPVHVWSPSTVFLDDGGGSAAYAIAKAAMEELGRRLPAHVSVAMPRLGRVATDQTAGLIQLAAAPALDVALAALRSA